MEARLLGAIGKIAGLAGLALGIFLLIFQGILSKDFLPKAGLNADQGYSIIMFMMIVTFGIAGIGLLAWLLGRNRKSISTLQLVAFSGLVLIVLIIAVTFAPTTANADAEREARLDAAIAANHQVVSQLTDIEIGRYVDACVEDLEAYERRTRNLIATHSEEREWGTIYVERWRNRAWASPDFSYADLVEELSYLVPDRSVFEGDWTEEEVTFEIDGPRRLVGCITDKVKALLGPEPPPFIRSRPA
ncbi:MAG: hypothetical protein HY834_15755 [Devosia nanyangense]|uniref:Uncharacterized protein n=1 Tax=Devosia nanyangense TaxID=1228055 RepID=A0A933P042_9HYPH|nr:hypothetical protein [Devosia nanyangense]